jgi:hypothetical protein
VTTPGGRDFQRGVIWGDGDEDNPRASDVAWKMGESDMVTRNPAWRQTEDETKEE